MNDTAITNQHLPDVTISQVMLPALHILKAILIGIPVIWIPVLFMLVLESGDGYKNGLQDTIFLDLYLLPVLKCLVIFPCMGLLLRFMVKVKSIRLSPAFPYPFLLAIVMLFILFCVVTSLPRLAQDPVVFIRIVLLQLVTVIIIIPMFFGVRGIIFSLIIFAVVRTGYWYATSHGLGQDYWLLSNTRAMNNLFQLFAMAIFYILIFLVFDYFRKRNRLSGITIIPGKDRFESLPQAVFDQWPLWRKLNWDPFTPMYIFIILAVHLFYLINMLAYPHMSFFIGWFFIATFTMMSVRLHWSMCTMRAQCRRLFLQCPENSRTRFFQHYIGFEILRFLPVLFLFFVLSGVISVVLERNYWWICIFSLIGYLMSWLGGMQLLRVSKKGVIHVVWTAISFAISISLYNLFWQDDILIIGLFVMLIMLMSLLLYLMTKRFCASEFEY